MKINILVSVIIVLLTASNVVRASISYRLMDYKVKGNIKIDLKKSTEVNGMSISHDGRYIISTQSDFSVRLFDNNSGIEKTLFRHNKSNQIYSLTFNRSDNNYFIGSKDNSIKLIDIFSNKIIREYNGHTGSITSLTVSNDSKYLISGSDDNSIKLWDINTGSALTTFTGHTGSIKSLAISPDGRYLVSGSADRTIRVWDVKMGNEVRVLERDADISTLDISPDSKQILSGHSTQIWDITTGDKIIKFEKSQHASFFSKDGRSVYSVFGHPLQHRIYIVNGVTEWDVKTGKQISNHEIYAGGEFIFSHNSNSVISCDSHFGISVRDSRSFQSITDIISFTDGEWIAITPDGYYNASPNGDKHLNVLIGDNVYGIENYREAFFRPDLIKIALSGGSLKGYRNIADVKQPPQVEIVDTPLTVAGDELTVKLKLTDIGGGIGDVRLYLNGSAIMLDNSRGLKVVDKGISRSYKIRLARGDNTIRAVAFNAENTMQSNPAEQTVTATFTPTSKPTLHALVIGVNEFKNPKLRLQYAVPDADLFTETLKKGASDLFGKVNVVRLTTPEQTTSEYIASELKKMRSINPDDMFILFVASHGTVDDGEYFLITSNVGSTSTAKLKTDALSQEKIKELIANIPATKKVIVLDTCNAGQMGDAIQVAMLTRGMSEDTAFKILSRAVGSTILSSATSTQEALEGYQGHGLFTWVLAEGMKGKADKGKTGYIKTTDLVDYVESEVPDIAEKHFKRKQYPTTAVSGQGFPIGKAGL